MSIIKFTVEDSKVSEILQALLNSGVVVKNVEVTNTQHSKATMVSKSSAMEAPGSSFVLYRYSHSIDQNGGTCTAAAIPGVRLVGGTIFYIDGTADGEYQFFDADGNPIENVQIGDKPYAYRVLNKGSKDKYYVYHDEVYDNLRWTYWKDNGYVYESLNTSADRGSGKINTEIVMAKDNGAYITSDSNGIPTIWYKLQQVRNARVGGCDDWFVPSAAELELLRLVTKSGSITGGIIAGLSYDNSVFNNRWVWSSSEFLLQRACYWYYAGQHWDAGNKGLDFPAIFIRAF